MINYYCSILSTALAQLIKYNAWHIYQLRVILIPSAAIPKNFIALNAQGGPHATCLRHTCCTMILPKSRAARRRTPCRPQTDKTHQPNRIEKRSGKISHMPRLISANLTKIRAEKLCI